MAQDPFLVDAIQFEVGSGDTLTISRDSSTGAMTFVDAVVTGGITLKQLAGLSSVENVITVGKSGTGAEYTTIQGALDTIPAGASATNRFLILIAPGVYQESVNIVRDYTFVVGLGGVLIQSEAEATPDGVGADHTVVIHTDLGTTPTHVELHNLTITNSHTSFAAVRIPGGSASTLGSDRIVLKDCFLRSSSAGGGYTLWATAANNIFVQGGSWAGTTATSLCLVEEVASFVVQGVEELSALQLDYDNAGTKPSVAGSEYRIVDCDKVATNTGLGTPISSDLDGAGSLTFKGCADVNDITMAGDQTLEILSSDVGDLTLNDTVAVTLVASRRGTATGVTATLQEGRQQGSVAFAGTSSEAVTFTVSHPDSSYQVHLEMSGNPGAGGPPWVTLKTANGFTINFASNVTQTVSWTAERSS